jgi:hypothetical protein
MKFAKRLSENFVNKYIDASVPWGEAGYVTYKRTYARHLDDDQKGPREEWWQTCQRMANGLLDIGGQFSVEEIEEFYDNCFHLRGLPAGRHIWQLGTKTVERLGADSLQSCWHVRVDEPYYPFLFTFDKLMLGGGVGFNIQKHHVYALPKVRHSPIVERVDDFDCDLIVTDNREGWIELLRRVLKAFFETGKPFRYNTRCIREKGKPIKSFGGIASGSEKLVEGIELICRVLRRAYGRKLSTVDCLDIMNIIGMIVVAGNVRRSAEIACGDPDDVAFILAKNWNHTTIPPWRQQSNNTCITEEIAALADEFWYGYELDENNQPNGEAYGLFNPHLARNFGRLCDGFRHGIDAHVEGPNPCGEITLEDSEACNLGELFLVNIEDEGQLHRVAELLFRAQKTVSILSFTHDRTNEVVRRNHRIGLGMTGYIASPQFHDRWVLNNLYNHITEIDSVVSRNHNCGMSIKRTTMKPSGTLSLLAKRCTAGANVAYDEFVIRRITFATTDPILDALRSNGYRMEPKINIDGSRDHSSTMVEFPVSYEGCKTNRDSTVMDQLRTQEHLQTYYVDNSVSMTAYYRPEEIDEIRPYLEDFYRDHIKTISFSMHQHGFRQAPFESITREQYEDYSRQVKPLTRFGNDHGDFVIGTQECDSGVCPAR